MVLRKECLYLTIFQYILHVYCKYRNCGMVISIPIAQDSISYPVVSTPKAQIVQSIQKFNTRYQLQRLNREWMDRDLKKNCSLQTAVSVLLALFTNWPKQPVLLAPAPPRVDLSIFKTVTEIINSKVIRVSKMSFMTFQYREYSYTTLCFFVPATINL